MGLLPQFDAAIKYLALGLLVLVAPLGAQTPLPPPPATPTPIILDTDVGTDLDDAYAIAVALRAERLGYLTIKAITTSNMVDKAPAFVQTMLAYAGRGATEIPVGAFQGSNDCSGEGDNYAGYTISATKLVRSSGRGSFPSAAAVLRQVLDAAADHSITIVTIGGQSNIALLMQSQPDKYSSLSGAELWNRKVAKMIAMNTPYPGPPAGWDYNTHCDAAASAYVYQHNGAVPVIGNQMDLSINIGGCYDGAAQGCTVSLPPNSPLRVATDYWVTHGGGFAKRAANGGRPAWDPSTVFFVMVGTDAGPGGPWFKLSGNGTFQITGIGYAERNTWTTATQSNHFYTIMVNRPDFPAALNELALADHFWQNHGRPPVK